MRQYNYRKLTEKEKEEIERKYEQKEESTQQEERKNFIQETEEIILVCSKARNLSAFRSEKKV